MRRALLSCLAIAFAFGCGDDITEPVPERTTAVAAGPLFATTTTEDGLSISTDKDDYAPGDVVHLTGAGWPANDVLDIRLDDEPATHAPHTWTINVAEDGTFHDSSYLVDVGDYGVTFTLTATSRASGQNLTVTFTDGRDVTAVTLNGASTATVAANGAVTANVVGQLTGNNNNTLGSIGVKAHVDGSLPSTAVQLTCYDVNPNQGPSTPSNTIPYNHTFSFNAPSNVGVYDMIVTSFSDNSCAVPMGSFPFPINDGITVQASNQAPTADAGGPYTGNEGQEITLNGSGSTDTDGTISVYSWTYEVVTADPGASCSLTSANTASPKITCNDDGSYKVKLTVTDDDGAPDDAEATLTLANVGPTATFSAPTPVNEGSPISLSFSSPQDAANDVAAGFTYAFDCGDGAGYGTFGSGTSASCPTTDNGSRTVKGKIKDKDAGETEYTAIVTVNNVAPDIASPLTKPDGSALPISITVGATVAFKASFTDPGTGDTHNAEITCSPTSSVIGGGAVTQPSFQGSCTFTTVGSKTISVKVTDDDGDFDVETYNISVLYDFRGFFSPVDNPGPYNTMNVANAGQAIPLKWQLLDYAGNPVTNLIGVNVTAVTLTCSLGTTTDLLEEYAAGSSGLQNLGNGFYQFNWKTPTGYARSCKTMNLDLGEGTPRIALFQFRK